jgi:glutathione S-transferase
MTSITLWGRLSSCNVQKVIWTLEELELPYEHVPLGGKHGGNDTPEYRAMNPNGLVPTLRDGELVIWESHAIVRYLSAEYGSGLLFPMEARDRAAADQWTDWTATTFQPAWIGLFWAKVRTPTAEQDSAAIAKAFAASVRCFDIIERRLGEAPYLAGKTLTYADIVAGVALYRWTTMEIERPMLPNVQGWHARLSERAAFRKAVSIPYEELVGRLAF